MSIGIAISTKAYVPAGDAIRARSWYEIRRSGFAGRATRSLPAAELTRLLADPDALWRHHWEQAVKISHSTLIVEARLPLEGKLVRVAYKRCQPKSLWKGLLTRMRGSRAARGWHMGRLLREQGIATAEPILLCEPQHWSLRKPSYLATRWIEGSTSLDTFLCGLALRPIEQRRRCLRQLATNLGQMLGRMHAAGIANRDLKAPNLLVVDQREQLTVHLVDLDGVRLRKQIDAATRAINLARLAVSLDACCGASRSYRLRFLGAYLQATGLPRAQWKELWRSIEEECRRFTLRKQRQGRPVC